MTVCENSSFHAFYNEKRGKNAIFGAISHMHARANIRYMTKVTTNKSIRLSEQLLKYIPILFAVILWCVLSFREQFFLKKVEDLSVFLFDKLFIMDSFKTPGGFLGLAGSFLTQFLYIPWLGALIWIALLLLSYYLTIRALRIPERYRPIALIPVALLVIGNMSLGYGVFIMREQDHFFAPVLGYLAALIPLFAIKRTQTVASKLILLTIWTAIGFPLFGTFAFIGTLTAACTTFMDQEMLRSKRLTILAVSLALIIFIPLIAYSFYTSYRLVDSWHMGLPSISDDQWTFAIRTPFQLALLFLPVMAIASRRLKETDSKNIIFQTSVYIISATAVWGFWFKDDNFRTELAMSEAVDRFEWQEVVDFYRKAVDAHVKSDDKAYDDRTAKLKGVKDQDTRNSIIDSFSDRFFEPTRTMVLYRDLALLKMNRALDEAFTMKDGGRLQKSRTQIPMAFQSGKQFYLQYGLVNMSYRWCMEDVIEHNWSYSTLKYMAMHCIIMQESEFARKYLNKLEKTIFYRKWAKGQGLLAADSVMMSVSEPYQSILPYMCFENRMTNDLVKSETFLMKHFSESEPPQPTPEYDRAALLWAMRTQNIPLFWERLYYYIKSNKVEQLPKNVQEAALLYGKLEKPVFDLPYSKEVENSYDAFNRYTQTNPVRNMKESAYPYSKKFGKTFYYYYYFIRDIQTY